MIKSNFLKASLGTTLYLLLILIFPSFLGSLVLSRLMTHETTRMQSLYH